MSKVKNGDFVQLHYTGTLEDGSVFDSSEGRSPLEFQVGGGGIIQGFNDAVMDMALEEEKNVVLSPDQAYGDPREDLKREFPASMLEGNPVEVGQQLRFSSPHGPVSGTVLSIESDKFTVDFNHPLAGQTLQFAIKVVGISDAPTQQQGGCSCSTPSSCSSGCDSCG
ncbi:MAG: FKBP-type peptidyl-prolyl cis-trans isomerase [Desulfobaccales bacterium]